MAAGPFLCTEHFKWFYLIMASNWCRQQRRIDKTCNSRRFPDACGAFNKKNILSSFKMLCIKCSRGQKYKVIILMLSSLVALFCKQSEHSWKSVLGLLEWKMCKVHIHFGNTQPGHKHWQEHCCHSCNGPSTLLHICCLNLHKIQRQQWNCPLLYKSKVPKVNCKPTK